MDASELLVLCSGQPGFLRAMGGKLVGKCRLLECYSLTEAAQMIQLHQPPVALIDLRNSAHQRLERSFAMAQNSESTVLMLITNRAELNRISIPLELAHRVVHLKVEAENPDFDASVAAVEDLMNATRRQSRLPTLNANLAENADGPVNRISGSRQLTRPDVASARPRHARGLAERFRTETPALQNMLTRLEVAARHDVTILLIGETGSGKTHLARLIHESSSRVSEPFLTVACGALPGELIESELFGHAKGAFTSAHADKEGKFLAAGRGTILLDEIDVLTPEQQVKLLRVIEQGLYEAVGANDTMKVEARIIAASNLELQPLVENGRFRPDLYYRLNTLCFTIPPLRQRLPDIEPLARHFVHSHAQNHQVDIREIDRSFIDCLIKYPWPGNVREMENAIRSAVIYSNDGCLSQSTLPPNIVSGAVGPASDPSLASLFGNRDSRSLGNRIEFTEKDIIEQALQTNSFSRTKTARHLGISRVTLYNKMKKYGMMPAK